MEHHTSNRYIFHIFEDVNTKSGNHRIVDHISCISLVCCCLIGDNTSDDEVDFFGSEGLSQKMNICRPWWKIFIYENKVIIEFPVYIGQCLVIIVVFFFIFQMIIDLYTE